MYDNKSVDNDKFQWIGEEFWDIFIAEELKTTPWDVREHITIWDFQRLNLLNKARNLAHKRVDAFHNVKNSANNSLSGKR